MSVGLDQLRLVAALAHSAADADVELIGPGRRWLVSYRRAGATIHPCTFRQLVLATQRGCRVGILPADQVHFVGGLLEIGGGVFQRRGEQGPERRLATFLTAAAVEALLDAGHPHAGDAMTASLQGDDGLGVTVVTLAAAHPVFDHRLDVLAHWLMARCLVEELIDASLSQATP